MVEYCPSELTSPLIVSVYTQFFGFTVPSTILTSIFYYKIFRKLRTTGMQGSRNTSLNICFFVISLWWFLSNVPFTVMQAFLHLFPDLAAELDNHWTKGRYLRLGFEFCLLLSKSFSFVNSIILIVCVRHFSEPIKAISKILFSRLVTCCAGAVTIFEQVL